MIVFRKKFLYCTVFVSIYFILILLGISIFSTNQTNWLSNTFFDKVFLFLLTPIFAFIASSIGESGNTTFYIRTRSRTRGIAILLKQQYIVSIVYVTLWILIICVFLIFRFGNISPAILSNLCKFYFRYILGYVIFINLSTMFSRTQSKQLSTAPYACSYLLLVAEILVFYPTVDKMPNLPNISLVYSWIFSSNPFAALFLIMFVVITTFIIFQYYSQKDIY